MCKANLNWDDYIEYINQPKHLVNPVRDIVLFDNYFLEFFSKTPWYGVPIAWLPFIYYYLSSSECSFSYTLAYVFLGVLLWTLGEYMLHRFFFHSEDSWLPNHPQILAHHFMIHGIHHAFPQDRMRLVFPILPGYLIFTACFIKPVQCLAPVEY